MSEKIGEEYRVARHELSEAEVEEKRREIAGLYERKREAESSFTSFKRWASPRIRKAFDPDYESKELAGVAPLTATEAHGLRQELHLRQGQRNARVGSIKADLAAFEHAVANGYEYRRIECDLLADVDKAEVAYVCKRTGQEVDRRAMTGDERQLHLPETSGGPKKKRKNGALDSVR